MINLIEAVELTKERLHSVTETEFDHKKCSKYHYGKMELIELLSKIYDVPEKEIDLRCK